MKQCIGLTAFVSAMIFVFGCGPMDEIDAQNDDSTRVVNHDRTTEETFLPGSCKNPSGGNYCGKKSPDNCWCDNLCVQYNDCCEDKKQVCDGGPTPTPTPGPTPTPTPAPGKSCKNPSGGNYCGKKSPDGCWCDNLCSQYNDCCPDKQQVCDGNPTPTPTPNPTPTPTPGPTPTPQPQYCMDCHPNAHHQDKDCFSCHTDG